MIPKTFDPRMNYPLPLACAHRHHDPGEKGKKAYPSKNRKPICHNRNRDKHNRSPNINRHRQHITHERIIPNTLQNPWQKCAEPIQQNILAELRDAAEHELGITQRDAHLCPAEFFTAHIVPALLVADAHHPFVFVVEEVGVCWVVGEAEPY